MGRRRCSQKNGTEQIFRTAFKLQCIAAATFSCLLFIVVYYFYFWLSPIVPECEPEFLVNPSNETCKRTVGLQRINPVSYRYYVNENDLI